MRRLTPEEKYKKSLLKQQKILYEFANSEIEWSEDLMLWYKHKKEEMPDDVYRACAFFQNKEYLHKPGSLTLLYKTCLQCSNELPAVTKELAFDLLSFRYKTYSQVLKTGGYDGPKNW
jgi:hypothetical protein